MFMVFWFFFFFLLWDFIDFCHNKDICSLFRMIKECQRGDITKKKEKKNRANLAWLTCEIIEWKSFQGQNRDNDIDDDNQVVFGDFIFIFFLNGFGY